MKPLTLTYAFLCFLVWPTDVNCIKPKEVKLAGEKNNSICKPFEVSILKQIGKLHNNCTVNDVVLSLVSISMREYMRNHEDYDSKSINMLIPFSFRELPKTKKDHYLDNDFSALCFTLKLYGTFEDAIAGVKKTTTAMKTSIYPHGLGALT